MKTDLNQFIMKKGILSVLIGIAVIFAVSCSKDEDPNPGIQLATAPEALAEHDTKSGGIYKGTFATATTSGSMKVNLQAGKTEIIIIYLGSTRTLTTSDLTAWVSGDTLSAVFTSGDWSAVFASSGDGSNFTIGLNLAGTTSFQGAIVKERSNLQVKVYEGSYSGDATGKWNFCTQNNLLAGFFTGSATGYLDGTISGTTINMFETGGSVTATGTLTNEGRDCNGTWENSGDTGAWTGTRMI